jgi:endonuclease YncB( thermonuclease family)
MGPCLSKKEQTNTIATKDINVCVDDQRVSQLDPKKDIAHLEPDKIPYFSFKGRTFYAKPCNIYDGDTFSICWIWKGEPIKYRCRCLGYDSPEMKPSLSNPNRDKEKELAKAAKARFTELVSSGPDGLVKVECGDFDKYGRILVTVWIEDNPRSINQIMLDEGHAKAYDGGTKTAWT